MPKNGKDHLLSLRDGRQIFIDGQLVKDHVSHPAFRSSIRSVAAMYDYQASAENLRKMTFPSPATGNCVNRMWQLPTSYHELVERRAALEAWATLSCGFLGRSPDHVASVVSGMYMGLDIFRQHGKRYGQALSDYYEYARDHDLYLTYAIISPQANRSKGVGDQAEDFTAAAVVDEDSEGITLQGAKMLATSNR
jgi:4-hydroxyphenylacetate 3-monooxygenase